jgi:myosin heavy subunit
VRRQTENTKKVIQYLTAVAGKGGGVGLLEEQLLKCVSDCVSVRC